MDLVSIPSIVGTVCFLTLIICSSYKYLAVAHREMNLYSHFLVALCKLDLQHEK